MLSLAGGLLLLAWSAAPRHAAPLHGVAVPAHACAARPPVHAARPPVHAARMVAIEPELENDYMDFDTLGQADQGPIGVLLLSVGSPETPDDVEEYLYNVFSDSQIETLPRSISWALKRPLAWYLAKTQAEQAKEGLVQMGGTSPQLPMIRDQAAALEKTLAIRGIDSKTFVAMRYWHPYAEEAVESMKEQNITKLVILPLYPQFSISTSGSALRVLERLLYTDPSFPPKSTVVPSWFNRAGFLKASAQAIAKTLRTLPQSDEGSLDDVHILYSAQGLPRKYVDELGDPYQEQVERTVALIDAELERMGLGSPSSSLGFQGQIGPARIPWIAPDTRDEIERLGKKGVKALVMVPISFVFEHVGTLNVMDREYAALAAECGVKSFARVPALGNDPEFIGSLASVVMEALPDLTRSSMQQINEGNPVALNVVNEYVTLYTKDELQLVPQERPWGFTEQAEVVNGRIAMAAITASLALSVDPSLKAIVEMYRASKAAAGGGM